MNAYAAMKQYQTVNVNAQVSEADPHRLICKRRCLVLMSSVSALNCV